MEVIPAIDLRGGQCVRLYQGDYSKETVFSTDPASVARTWRDRGATRLHVVDLDGAAEGRIVNQEAIQSILRAVPIPVELSGGIRDMEAIDLVLSWGVDRVSLGTVAVRQPQLVREACRKYPNLIIIGVDAKDGRVAVQGWRETTDVTALQLIKQMEDLGVPRFSYTDISRDGTGTEPNYQALEEVIRATSKPVIAAGGVSSEQHLQRLKEIGAEGAIIGQALYTGVLDLKRALAVAAAR